MWRDSEIGSDSWDERGGGERGERGMERRCLKNETLHAREPQPHPHLGDQHANDNSRRIP